MPYIKNKKCPFQDFGFGKHILTDAQVAALPVAERGFYTSISTSKTGNYLFMRKASAPALSNSQPIYLTDSEYCNLSTAERNNYVQKVEFTELEWRAAYN